RRGRCRGCRRRSVSVSRRRAIAVSCGLGRRRVAVAVSRRVGARRVTARRLRRRRVSALPVVATESRGREGRGGTGKCRLGVSVVPAGDQTTKRQPTASVSIQHPNKIIAFAKVHPRPDSPTPNGGSRATSRVVGRSPFHVHFRQER